MDDPRWAAKLKLGIVAIIVVFAVVIGFRAIFSMGRNQPSPQPAPAPAPVVVKPDTPENQDPYTAFGISKKFMERQLKAPASAKWPSFSDDRVDVGFAQKSQLWIVKSYVDSQNSYGALIRTLYVISLEYIPGEGWKMADLQTGE